MSQRNDLRDVFKIGCPACGQANQLVIMITTLSRVTPDGSEPEGDHEWDDASYCRCPECGHDGTVAGFTQAVSDVETLALANVEGEVQA